MTRLTLSVIVMTAALTGCTGYVSRPLDAGQSASAFAGRSLNDPGLRTFLASQGAAGGTWGVDRLALVAAYFHGDVRVARAEAREAAAGIGTAAEIPNPVLTFSPAYNKTSAGVSPWVLGPSLDFTIETGGKRRHRVVAARATAEAAQLRVSEAAWTMRAKVRTALLDLYAAREQKALLAEEVALHTEAVQKLDAQVKAGESASMLVVQERLGLNRSKLSLHDAEKLATTAHAQLAAAIGVPSAALDSLTLDFSAFQSLPAAPGPAVRRRALTERADLLSALADYAVADAALRLEIAKQYPDIHLSPGYEYDQGDNKWSLGFSLDLPILNQHRGPIGEAEAKRNTAAEKFEAKQAAVFGEIETALAAYSAARAKSSTAAQLAADTARAGSTTRHMVEAGELSALEGLTHRIEASAAALSQLEARIQAQEALGLLEAATRVTARRLSSAK